MRYRETLEQMVARINAGGYLPTRVEPTGNPASSRPARQAKRRTKMAKTVKLPKNREFQFAPTGGGAVASKYPWDEWFKGDLLLLEQSEGKKDDKGTVTEVTTKKDYEVDTDAMPAKIKTAARRRYKVCQISRRDADGKRLVDSLIIRARDMDAAERQAEDILRAEEKEEMKAKKKEKASTNGTPAAADTAATATAEAPAPAPVA